MTLKEIEIAIHQSIIENRDAYNKVAEGLADRKIMLLDQRLSLLVDDETQSQRHSFLMQEINTTRQFLSEQQNLMYIRVFKQASSETLSMLQNISEGSIRLMYEQIYQTEHHLPPGDIEDKLKALEKQSPAEFRNEFDKTMINVLANEKYFDYLKGEKDMLDQIAAISLDDVASNVDIEYSIEGQQLAFIEPQEAQDHNKATTAQQVLMMHYFFEALDVPGQRTAAAKVRAIKMLTGRNADTIRDYVENPLEFKHKNTQKKNLEFVRQFFIDLKLDNIVADIDKDLRSIHDQA